jgi:peptide/nickel transport system permease protein
MTDAAAAAEAAAAVSPTAPEPTARPARQRSTLELLLRTPTFLVGAAIILFFVGCALFGTSLVPYDPYADDLLATLQPPSAAHWFGTDQLGRDVFSRVIAGARDILTIAPLATLLGTAAGTAVGLTAGYFGGWTDAVISRLVEVLLSLPLIIVALLVLVALGPATVNVILVVGLVFTPLVARTVRAAVLTERHLDYVAAASVRGETALHIMFVEILPNIWPPIIVEATVRLGYAIFTIASLSFLGFGVQPPSPDWGLSIAENYGVLVGGFWWTVMFAVGAVALLVIGVNLCAEAVQKAIAE